MKLKVFKMQVEMENAAFEDNPEELQRIVRKAASTVDLLREESRVSLFDANGNKVGFMEIITSAIGSE